MPLELLLILVIGGIAAIAVLLHVTGRSKLRDLDQALARQAWARQFPEAPIANLILAENGHAALIKLADANAPAGLVWSFGADTVARSLEGVRPAKTENGLRLSFADFAAPQVQLMLNPTEAKTWHRMITTRYHAAVRPNEV